MIDEENTGEEMATSSLNTTLAMAVPKKAKTKIKPTDEVTASIAYPVEKLQNLVQ